VITLDWDNINYEEAAKRTCEILASGIPKSLEIRVSPNLDGFHIYIETEAISEILSYNLRRVWRDDGRRILGDYLAPKAIYRNVMFVYKSSPLGTLGEIPIVKYERMTTNNWKIWHLSPKHPLPTPLQELPWLLQSVRDSSQPISPRST